MSERPVNQVGKKALNFVKSEASIFPKSSKCYYCKSEKTIAIETHHNFLPSGKTISYIQKCQDCNAGSSISKQEYELRKGERSN